MYLSSIYLPMYLSSFYLPMYLPISLSIHPPIYPSIYLSTWQAPLKHIILYVSNSVVGPMGAAIQLKYVYAYIFLWSPGLCGRAIFGKFMH